MFFLYKKIGDGIMKKTLSMLIIITLLLTTVSCSMRKNITITKENFEQYFNIEVRTSNYKRDESYLFGVPLTDSYIDVEIEITPKQTINSGSVSVVLEDDHIAVWSSEYTMEGGVGVSVPIQFAPNQTYIKKFSMTSQLPAIEPNFSFDIIEASGTIVI